MELKIIPVKKPDDVNVIIGQAHFIKTVEDIHEAMVNSVPGIKFGLAFCESSGPRLVRSTGTDEEMEKLAIENALEVGAGHSFFLFLKNAYPINVMRALKEVPEVVAIYCATANPVKLVVVEEGDGRGIIGVIDGGKPLGVEGAEDKENRHKFLRNIGYKL
ncbi:hypothetical protein DRQ18_00790 [bacterium]|nr:MAG: hypothetical protein DRQ18_00790 [bacterium]